MYKIIQKKNLWVGISGVLVVLSILAISLWGLRLGIDFTGGSLMEVSFKGNQPSVVEIQDALNGKELGSLSIQPTSNTFILRFQDTSEAKHQEASSALKVLAEEKNKDNKDLKDKSFEEYSFTSIGPSIGKELQRKAFSSIIIVLIVISAYISYAFRKVSKPLASWKYGVATLIALFHDTLITVAFFSVLGHFWGVEVNTSFITAVLTVLGFSVHDTIVVFDRIRENLPKSAGDFDETVNKSVNQTLTRSINTSMTVILTLLCIVLFGGLSIKYFALALLVGIFFGTYSSIFLASPILVIWNKLSRRNK